MRATPVVWFLAWSGVVACGGDDGAALPPVVGMCGDGGAPSASPAALLDRPPTAIRVECLDGVYENTGVAQGGDFYTNTYVSRMELRPDGAMAALRCTFEGPLSNPPAQRDPRSVIASVQVGLVTDPTGVAFTATAADRQTDPFYVGTCEATLSTARWGFCVVDGAGIVEPGPGDTTCAHVTEAGDLELIEHTTTTRYTTLATKIAD